MNFVDRNCLETENDLEFESLEACKGKMAAIKITKIQIFSFWIEKCLSVWSYDKTISTVWQRQTFSSKLYLKLWNKNLIRHNSHEIEVRIDKRFSLLCKKAPPMVDVMLISSNWGFWRDLRWHVRSFKWFFGRVQPNNIYDVFHRFQIKKIRRKKYLLFFHRLHDHIMKLKNK